MIQNYSKNNNMARERFEHRKLTGSFKVACKFDDGTVKYWEDTKENIVSYIRSIIDEYYRQGHKLTLRQLHYQLVTKNWIINHDTAYKKLGSILDDCKYAGVVDWDMVEDRGRQPYIPYSVTDIPGALQDTVETYRLNRQREQKNHVELWTEKDALSGILRRSTVKYHIQLVVNKGYTSSSALYGAYQRYLECINSGQRVTILYFGDHDPSGLDMIRDIKERLLLFLSKGTTLSSSEFLFNKILPWWEKEGYTIYTLLDGGYISEKVLGILQEENEEFYEEFDQARIRFYLEDNNLFNVIPIGLTMEQIKKYNLPPNPTKITDSRADNYIRQFGKTCWEVDALKPQTLTSIVETNIKDQIDMDLYESTVEAEGNEIIELTKLIDSIK